MKKTLLTLAITGLAFGLTACDKKAPATAAPASGSSAPAPAGAPALTDSAAPAAAPAEAAAETAAKRPASAFENGLNALGTEISAATAEAQAANDPMLLMKKLPDVLAKAKNLPTEGLPEEVKTTFTAFLKNMETMVGLMSALPPNLPGNPAEVEDYLKGNPEAQKTLEELEPKIQAAGAEGYEAKNALKAAAEKNGMDLSKFLNAGS